MEEKGILYGFGALIALLFVAAVASGVRGGKDTERDLANRLSASEDSVAAMTAQIEDLQAQVAGVAEAASTAASSEDVAALQADVASVAEAAASGDAVAALQEQVAGIAETAQAAASGDAVAALQGQVDDIQSGLANTQSELAGLGGTLSEVSDDITALAQDIGTVSAAPIPVILEEVPAEAIIIAAEAPEEVAPLPMAPEGFDGYGVGSTAVFADGALRIFVSRLDAANANARVSVNGDLQTLASGDSATVPVGNDFCEITLGEVYADAAGMNAACGDDLEPAVGIKVGETELLEDGKIRVFASLVGDGAARISVNGDLVTLDAGGFTRTDLDDARCRITLNRTERGHAQVSSACGAPVVASDPVAPGATAILGDGAARVFVSAVQRDAVRFAVNGVDMITASAGTLVALDDACGVSVETVRNGQASFGYECTE